MYILTKVSDILHSVFSSYKEKVLPWFEQLLQLIVNLIVSMSSPITNMKCIYTQCTSLLLEELWHVLLGWGHVVFRGERR